MSPHICLQVLGTRLAAGTECAAIITACSRVCLKLATGGRAGTGGFLWIQWMHALALRCWPIEIVTFSDKRHFWCSWMSGSLSKQMAQIPQSPSRTCQSFAALRD